MSDVFDNVPSDVLKHPRMIGLRLTKVQHKLLQLSAIEWKRIDLSKIEPLVSALERAQRKLHATVEEAIETVKQADRCRDRLPPS